MKKFSESLFRSVCTSLAVILAMMAGEATLQAQDLDVPYVPTPQDVVERMLEIADVKEGDYVIDLGSGDGRIVITAAQMGAVGHGIDLDPERIKEARANAEEQGVDDRVMFLQEDIFETDFSDANVITMYLLTSVNRELRPRLLEELTPGTRVVSHSFDMGDWEPDMEESVDSGSGSHRIYFWIIPARVEGDWNWTVGDRNFSASIDQQYQMIDVSVTSGGSPVSVEETSLTGERISIILNDAGTRYILSGRAADGAIEGTAQIHRDNTKTKVQWTGSRN